MPGKVEHTEEENKQVTTSTKDALKEEQQPVGEEMKKEGWSGLLKLKEEQNDELELKPVGTEKPKIDQPAIIDNRVSTIKSLMKDEPRDSSRHWNAISVVMAPGCLKQDLQTKTDAYKDKKAEDVERAIKNDQQAKIPLKKRELKRSDNYDSSRYGNINHNNNNVSNNGGVSIGGIIVRNPAVLPLTDQVGSLGTESQQKPTSEPVEKTMPVEVNKNTVRERYVGIGVIMGPVERKRAPPEPDSTPTNGLHGDGKMFKAEATPESVRQSVLVRKPSGAENAHHSSINEDRALRAEPAEAEDSAQGKAAPTAANEQEDVSEMKSVIKLNSVDQGSPKGIDSQETLVTSSVGTVENTVEDVSERRKATGLTDEGREGSLEAVEDNQEQDKGHKSSRKRRSEKTKKVQSGEEHKRLPCDGAANNGDEEVSSELQKEGIRLKIKIPLHRRTPELQLEREREETPAGDRRSLRRSARICKPSPKLAEIQDRKHERKQAAPPAVQEVEEHEHEKAAPKMDGPTKSARVTYSFHMIMINPFSIYTRIYFSLGDKSVEAGK